MKITRKNWGWVLARCGYACLTAFLGYHWYGEHAVTWTFSLFILIELYFISEKLDKDE